MPTMITRRELILFLLLFLASLPAVTTRIYASDEIQYFVWLRSAVFDHDVDFDDEYRYFYDSGIAKNPDFHATFLEDDTRNEAGRRQNNGPVGAALMWSPFYAIGHVVARVTGARADGYSHPYVAAIAYGSALYGALAVLLSISIARRVVGHGRRAALAILAGTPLLFYMYVTPGFAHANEAFAVSLFLWIWLRVRGRWATRDLVLLAAAGALMTMVRDQALLIAAGPAIDYLRSRHRAWRSSHEYRGLPRPAIGTLVIGPAAAAVTFVIAYAPQLLAARALNGHIGPSNIVKGKLHWWAPNPVGLAGVLMSPHHGLFAWTPLTLLAIAGLTWLAMGRVKRDCSDCRWMGLLGLVMIALQVYVCGAFTSWTVAGSFGQRRFVGLTPVFAIGLAALYAAPWSRMTRGLILAGTVLCLWWNLGLMTLFGANQMDRQRLHLGADAKSVFVTLPLEAPPLMWRYFTNRSSFYQHPRR